MPVLRVNEALLLIGGTPKRVTRGQVAMGPFCWPQAGARRVGLTALSGADRQSPALLGAGSIVRAGDIEGKGGQTGTGDAS